MNRANLPAWNIVIECQSQVKGIDHHIVNASYAPEEFQHSYLEAVTGGIIDKHPETV